MKLQDLSEAKSSFSIVFEKSDKNMLNVRAPLPMTEINELWQEALKLDKILNHMDLADLHDDPEKLRKQQRKFVDLDQFPIVKALLALAKTHLRRALPKIEIGRTSFNFDSDSARGKMIAVTLILEDLDKEEGFNFYIVVFQRPDERL